MSYVSIGVAIAGVALNQYNTHEVNKRQDNNLASSLLHQQSIQDQANQKTNSLIQSTAASNDEGAKSSLLDKFHQQLLASQPNATGGLNQVGHVSDAYTAASNDAASGASTYGNERAANIASIDAPGMQRAQEAQMALSTGTDLGQLQARSASTNFLDNMRLKGIVANPWLTAASQGLQAYGTSHAGSAGSAGNASGAGSFNGVTGAGTYLGSGSLSTTWPGMSRSGF